VAPAAPVLSPPVPYPGYQYPTIWNGGDALSGGNIQWAQEDAAIHAATLQNWRIRILQAKKVQAELSRQLMDAATRATTDGAAADAVHTAAGAGRKKAGKKKGDKKKGEKKKGGKKLKDVTDAVAKLASSTAQALGSIEDQVADTEAEDSDGGAGEVKRILKQMDRMADEFRAEDSDLANDDDSDDTVVDGQ